VCLCFSLLQIKTIQQSHKVMLHVKSKQQGQYMRFIVKFHCCVLRC
jgi:hypothetical protein